MRWRTRLLTIAGAACAFAAIAAAPASAQVSFSFNMGAHGGPFSAPANCWWQRFDRGRVDLVEQVCQDRYGRSWVVPGSRYTLVDRNRQNWRRWTDRDYRDWDRRYDRRDWRPNDRRDHRDRRDRRGWR